MSEPESEYEPMEEFALMQKLKMMSEPEPEPEPLILSKKSSNSLWIFIMNLVKPWCEKIEQEPHRQPYTNEYPPDTDPDVIIIYDIIDQTNIYIKCIEEFKEYIFIYKNSIRRYQSDRNFLLTTKTTPICPHLITRLRPIMSYIKKTKKTIFDFKRIMRDLVLKINSNIIKITFLEDLTFPCDKYEVRDFDVYSDVVNIRTDVILNI